MNETIHRVTSQSDQRAFYNFAWRVYRDDPNWVPHLWPQRRAYLSKEAAFFNYGEGEFWLAKRGREVVGTIGTAIDHSRNHYKNWRAAQFGFFEVLPGDYAAAEALWQHACGWARARGMNELIGPYSFASNDDPGFLVAGFEYPPCILMGHNPPDYPQFALRFGFEVAQENLAYRYDFSQIHFDIANAPDVLQQIAARSRRRHQASIHSPRLQDWDSEVLRLHEVYNRSLAVLPEFSPIELAEFRSQADGLRQILDPELVFIAEVDGKTAGFSLGLPNIMEALIYANGLRSPWDYVRFAWAKRHIKSASFKMLAMDPDYWGYGLDVIMYLEMARKMIQKGYIWADASLTNANNPQTNKLATRMGARVYRRYHEYRLAL